MRPCIETATTPPPPTGDIRFNAASAAATTLLYVHDTTNNGTDIRRALLNLTTGDRIVIQQVDNDANFGDFTVSGPPVDNTTWTQIPVTSTGSGGTIGNNKNVLFATMGGGGGGGGGGVTSLNGSTGALTLAATAPVNIAFAGSTFTWSVTGAALTKTDDSNVTLTLGGTPATALLQATSITVGWTGT